MMDELIQQRQCRCKWCVKGSTLTNHKIDEWDEALMARWNSARLSYYTQHVPGTNERCMVFAAGSFELRVPSGNGGVPVFDDPSREALAGYLAAHENGVGAVVR